MGPLRSEIRLSDSKINQKKLIHGFGVLSVIANHDVIWLEVAMYEPLVMKPLEEVNELNGHGYNTLDGKVFFVFLEDVFDAQPQLLQHDVRLALVDALAVNFRETLYLICG